MWGESSTGHIHSYLILAQKFNKCWKLFFWQQMCSHDNNPWWKILQGSVGFSKPVWSLCHYLYKIWSRKWIFVVCIGHYEISNREFLRKKFRRALKVCVHAFKCMTISIFFSDLWRPLNHSTPKSDWPVPSPFNVTSLISENITGIKIQFAAKEWYLNRTP